jgi:hypothetical protein
MAGPASLAFTGGRLITLDPLRPSADTVIVEGDRIAAVGEGRWLRREVAAAVEVIDLKGRTCLPGFIDAHVHFVMTGLAHFMLDLTEVRSLPEALASLSQAAAARPAGEWVMAYGLAAGLLQGSDRRLPDRRDLDGAAADRPIFVGERTGHACAANSRALELLDLAEPTDGIERGPDGLPSGIFVAEANRLASDRADFLASAEIGYSRILEAASEEAVAAGLTTVHALDGTLPSNDPGVLALRARDPKAGPRVVIYYQTRQVEAAQTLGLPRIGGCGACGLDGAFTPRTARLLEPYPDSDGHLGLQYFEPADLVNFFTKAHQAGLQICVHCVGDGAVEQALSAFETVVGAWPRPDHRHRIEHAELITPGQIARARGLGVAFSIQPAFNYLWRHDRFYPPVIGEDRAGRVDPVRSLLDAGLPVGAGSDSAVTPLRPLLGVHSAVNHSNPAERIDVGAALRLFTQNNAWLAFEEQHKGSLSPGKLADLVVLAADPRAVDPAEIKDIPVVMTVVGGRVAYSAEG